MTNNGCGVRVLAAMGVGMMTLVAAGETYTSASYAQDGLVAQWDGFDNAGTGEQDFSATVWKNLKTSGGDINLTGCAWLPGSVSIQAVGSPLVCASDFTPALAAGTIEMFVEYSPVTTDCRRWDQYGTKGAADEARQTYSESNNNYYHEIIGSGDGKSDIQFGSKGVQFGVRLSFVSKYDTADGAHAAWVYMRNDWRKGSTPNTSSVNAFPSRFQFAKNAGVGSRVYAIRIYNRLLSDAEIESNRQIDIARFTDESTFPGVRWKTAADGAWGTAANWDLNMLPTGVLGGYLYAEGADHTVTYGTGSPAFPYNVYLRNLTKVTTLDICNDVTSDIGKTSFNVSTGGVVKVSAESGLFTKTSITASDDMDERLVVHGGTFLVDGGDVLYTNLYGKVVIDGGASQTGVVRVTGGRFSWQPMKNNKFHINRYGRVEVTGGLLELWNSQNLAMDNGVIDVSGDGTFAIRGSCYYTLNAGLYRFRENGRFQWTNGGSGSDRHTIKPAKSGETVCIEFLDTAATISDCDRITMGGTAGGTVAFKIDTTGTINFGNMTLIGDYKGVTRLDVLNGRANMLMYGFRVGSCHQSAKTDTAVTGVVNVAGGYLYTGAGSYSKDGSYLGGCVIGDGTYLNLGNWANTCFRGEVNISAGRVYHDKTMPIFVGAGPTAYGHILQTGGAFTNSASSGRLVLGLAGGTGAYVISNGTARVAGKVVLGGQFTNDLYSCKLANFPRNVHGGTGTLRVDGGSFRVDGDLLSGIEGNGVIAIGPAGTLDLRGNVTLSNATTTAGLDFPRTSKVTFTFGPEGCGVIDFTNAASKKGVITAEAGTKLEIDVSAYTGRVSWVPLVRHAKATPDLISGTTPVFAAADVTVIGDGKGARLVEGTHKGVKALWAVFTRGTSIVLR